jgi:hypothetical protein
MIEGEAQGSARVAMKRTGRSMRALAFYQRILDPEPSFCSR